MTLMIHPPPVTSWALASVKDNIFSSTRGGGGGGEGLK